MPSTSQTKNARPVTPRPSARLKSVADGFRRRAESRRMATYLGDPSNTFREELHAVETRYGL